MLRKDDDDTFDLASRPVKPILPTGGATVVTRRAR